MYYDHTFFSEANIVILFSEASPCALYNTVTVNIIDKNFRRLCHCRTRNNLKSGFPVSLVDKRQETSLHNRCSFHKTTLYYISLLRTH